jgi:hypothetical protein
MWSSAMPLSYPEEGAKWVGYGEESALARRVLVVLFRAPAEKEEDESE